LSNGLKNYLFTSESVTEGHPDKIADQISDAVLDEVMKEDPKGRVACETLVTTGLAVVAGEITTSAHIDYDQLVRDTIQGVGDSHDVSLAVVGRAGVMLLDRRQGRRGVRRLRAMACRGDDRPS